MIHGSLWNVLDVYERRSEKSRKGLGFPFPAFWYYITAWVMGRECSLCVPFGIFWCVRVCVTMCVYVCMCMPACVCLRVCVRTCVCLCVGRQQGLNSVCKDVSRGCSWGKTNLCVCLCVCVCNVNMSVCVCVSEWVCACIWLSKYLAWNECFKSPDTLYDPVDNSSVYWKTAKQQCVIWLWWLCCRVPWWLTSPRNIPPAQRILPAPLWLKNLDPILRKSLTTIGPHPSKKKGRWSWKPYKTVRCLHISMFSMQCTVFRPTIVIYFT